MYKKKSEGRQSHREFVVAHFRLDSSPLAGANGFRCSRFSFEKKNNPYIDYHNIFVTFSRVLNEVKCKLLLNQYSNIMIIETIAIIIRTLRVLLLVI